VSKVIDIVAVTRLAEKGEVDAVARLADDSVDPTQWYEPLANLAINEAALLPPTVEANGSLRRFRVAPRLTHHVRHCTKYLDSPVSADRVFVFSEDGTPNGCRAATLCELATGINHSGLNAVRGHLRRHDFSRWIGHVFGDIEMAGIVHNLESRHKSDDSPTGFGDDLTDVIAKRYEPNSSTGETT